MKIAISSASGLEAVTKREMIKLGLPDSPSINGRIIFDGEWKDVCLANLYLRTAGRVLIQIAEFNVVNFDQLFDEIYKIDWKYYLDEDSKIEITPKLVLSTIHAFSATQSIVKKAICKKLYESYATDNLPESGERYKIEIAIYKDHCQVFLDTSGEGLHRRGYRKMVGEAPLKETLAAGLILLSVWKPNRPFADLFCGTGTLAIEAAMIAKNIPSGFYRDFDFLHWKNAPTAEFDDIRNKAESEIIDNPQVNIFACDISDEQLKLARLHAKEAGVYDIINFEKNDMRNFKTDKMKGVIISNPPYGERLSDRNNIEKLYKDYGKLAKTNSDWCFYTLTPVTDFEKLFGKRCNKKRKLYNGNIECYYYSHLAELKK